MLVQRAVLAVVLAALGTAAAVVESPAPEALIKSVQSPGIQKDEARTVKDVKLAVGPAVVFLEEGVVAPAGPVGEAVLEFAFVGKGRFQLTPPDDIEQHQLVLFADRTTLDAPFEEAILIVGDPQLSARLLAGEKSADSARKDAVEKLFGAWFDSAERRRYGLRGMLLRRAAGEPTFSGLFAAWIRSKDPKDILFATAPEELAPARLVQFVPRKLSKQQLFELEGELAELQAGGHALDIDLKRMGRFDTWQAADITPSPAAGFNVAGVEPENYTLDLKLLDKAGALKGKAALRLRSTRDDVRTVRLSLFADLSVERISTSGAALPFLQERDDVIVLLPAPLARGETLELTVEYSGAVLQKLRRGLFTSWSTTGWYPRAGTRDTATYDVTLHYPASLALFAAGKRVDGGGEPGWRWDRFVTDAPSPIFGFEVGSFVVDEGQAGGVKVRAAFCKETQSWLSPDGRRQFVKNVEETVEFFARTFGPYPYETLTVVTTSSGGVRNFSQSLPGLVTLLDDELKWGGKTAIAGGIQDYRMTLAHEIAHQWWGDAVRPATDHDVWLSEGMAQYAALLMGREILYQGKEFVSPTRWSRSELRGSAMSNGWPVEWAGPIILGARLDSSKCPGCYYRIVYTKGAMVLEMLGVLLGEKDLVATLARLNRDHRTAPLTTAEFFSALRARSHQDLGWFEKQFVRGVGMPAAVYNYNFAQGPSGGWVVNVHLEQLPDVSERAVVVHRSDGTWDLERRRGAWGAAPLSRLALPFEVNYFKPEDRLASGGAAERRAKILGNFGRRGALFFEGATSDVAYRIDYEPRQFELNPDESVPIDVYDAVMDPKGALLKRARERLSAGDLDAAESVAKAALTAEVPAERLEVLRTKQLAASMRSGGVHQMMRYEHSTSVDLVDNVIDRLSELRVHVLLAEVELARGRLEQAAESVKRADKLTDGTRDPAGVDLVTIVRARLLLRQNKPAEAHRLLWRQVMDGGRHPADAWALLAITAQLKGDEDSLKKARRELRKTGAWIDLAQLTGIGAPAGDEFGDSADEDGVD